MHLKTDILYEVFRLGLTVHFADADISYVRPVWESYEGRMDRTGADVRCAQCQRRVQDR